MRERGGYRGHDDEGEPHAVLGALEVIVADVAGLLVVGGEDALGEVRFVALYNRLLQDDHL